MPLELPGRQHGRVVVTIGLPQSAGGTAAGAGARAIANPLTAQNALIRVSAEDMETIDKVVSRDSTDTRITPVELLVPAGRSRRFDVAARNVNNHVLYRGSTVVDLPAGETRRLAVVLQEISGPQFQSFGFQKSSNADLLADRIGTIEEDQVRVELSPLEDRSALVPSFEVAEGVRVLVNGQEQESGVTSQDFAQPISYLLVGPNGGLSLVEVTVGAVQSGETLGFEEFVFTKAANPDELLVDRVGSIDTAIRAVSAAVSDIADPTALVAQFQVPEGVGVRVGQVEQVPGETENDFTDPVVYTLYDAEGTVTEYTVTVTILDGTDPVSNDPFPFGFRRADNSDNIVIDRVRSLDPDGGQATIGVSDAVDTSALVASFDPPQGVRAFVGIVEQTPGVTPNDFSQPLTYRFVDQTGNTAKYEIGVTALPNDLSFGSFELDTVQNDSLILDRIGVIDEQAKTVSLHVTSVVDVSSLIPTFTVGDNVVVSVDGVPQSSGVTEVDFTEAVTYLLVGDGGTGGAAEWTVSVSVLPDGADLGLGDFAFRAADNEGNILLDRLAPLPAGGGTVEIGVSERADPTDLVPAFSLPANVKAFVGFAEQTSGQDSHDFSATVTYRFVDTTTGGVAKYDISTTVLPNNDPIGFSGFGFPLYDSSEQPLNELFVDRYAMLEGLATGTIDIPVADLVDVSSLVADFTTDVNLQIDIATPEIAVWVGDVLQEPGVTANDFSSPVTYTIADALGNVNDVTVTVSTLPEEPFIAPESFGFLLESNSGKILTNRVGAVDTESQTISVGVSSQADVSALEPAIDISGDYPYVEPFVGFEPQYPEPSPQDFTSPVVYYFVDTFSGDYAKYTVTVSTLSDDASFTLVDLKDPDLVPIDGLSIESDGPVTRLIVPTGTPMTQLAPVWTAADGAAVTQVSSYSSPTTVPAPIGAPDETDNAPNNGESLYNFAGPVTFTVTADDGVTSSETTAYLYYGDVIPGSTGAASAGIYVQDPQAYRVVLMDDLSPQPGVFAEVREGDLSAYGISDVDFDAFGNTYVSTSGETVRFSAHLSEYTFGGDFTGDSLSGGEFIAVDRVRDRLFFNGSDGVSFVDEVSTTTSSFSSSIYLYDLANGDPTFERIVLGDNPQEPIISTYGVTVDETGHVYVVSVSDDAGAKHYSLVKIYPDVEGAFIEQAVDLDDLPEFTPDYNNGPSAGSGLNYDLLYREGVVYLLSDPSQGGAAVLSFDSVGLSFLGAFGFADTDGLDTTGDEGEFLGPRRFVAVLNRRFIVIDESEIDGEFGPEYQDRLIFFDGLDGSSVSGWGVYGSSGYNDDQFRFFTGS